MRHNDAHHNNSLVQICTQWNLDRNPFIYVSCLPEGTKLHCIAAVLPLLLLQCWHFGWKQCDGFFGNVQPQLRRIAPWQPAGKLWEGLGSHRMTAMWVGCFADACPNSWWEAGIQFLTARWAVHLQYGVSKPACSHTCLTWEGWAGNPSFAMYCTSLCGQRKKGIQKYCSKT